MVNQVTTDLGAIGNVQGDVAEDLFRRHVAQLLGERGILIDRVDTHLKTPHAEYDIVAANGEQVVVLEIKNKLTSQDIQHFINVQLPQFKKEFPSFVHYKLYGAVGSLIVHEQLERQAAKAGLFVFTQSHKGGASIANKDNFQARVF